MSVLYRKALFVFILTLWCTTRNLWAQEAVIDSLKTVLARVPEDTMRTLILHKLAWNLQYVDPAEALKYGQEALELSQKLNFPRGEGAANNVLGSIYELRADYEQALDHYFKGLAIYEELHNRRGKASLYNNVGIIYASQSEYDKALEYYQKALVIFLDLNNLGQQVSVYNNIGTIYANKKQYEEALGYFLKARDLIEVQKEKVKEATKIRVYINIGNMYGSKHNSRQALEYFQRALQLAEKNGIQEGRVNALMAIGDLYKEEKEDRKAIAPLEEALKFSRKVGLREYIQDLELRLAESYNAIGLYKKAYDCHLLYASIHDSLQSQEKNRVITDMQTKYETNEKEKQIQILNKNKQIRENQLQHQRLMTYFTTFGLLGLMLVAGVLYTTNRRRKRSTETIKQASDELAKQKEVIEKKNYAIRDSLTYASLIQQATLLDEQEILKHFRAGFMHKFQLGEIDGFSHWFTPTPKGWVFALLLAKGTGVTGSFVAILSNTILNQLSAETDQIALQELAESLNLKLHAFMQRMVSQGEGVKITLMNYDRSRDVLQVILIGTDLYCIQQDNEFFFQGMPLLLGQLPIESEKFQVHELKITSFTRLYTWVHNDAESSANEKEQNSSFSSKLLQVLQQAKSLSLQEQSIFLQKEIPVLQSSSTVLEVVITGWEFAEKNI